MSPTTTARLRGNLSFVISCLALAVALSGTAYAVGLGPGSVDTKQLAKGAVTTKKLHKQAVTAPKIKPGAVRAAALADDSVGSGELVANSVGASEVADGSMGTSELADSSVGASELINGSVGAAELAAASVGSAAVADRSIRLHDLGGAQVNQTATVGSPISIAAGDCTSVRFGLTNPTAPGILGSMVVGTITTSTGGAVVSNTGFVVPTLVTETSQGGAQLHLGICAGGSAQTIPAGSIVTYSVIAP